MLGSYVRNYSIDRLISQFLNPESRKQQIISLGAGSDTRPFKLLKEHANLLYHELDFGVSTAHKARVIHNNVDMKRIVDLENGDCDFEKGEIHTRNYHLHPTDLRMIKNNGEFTLPGIDRDSESLIVSECCLCYLEPHESENVLNWIIQSFPNVGIILLRTSRRYRQLWSCHDAESSFERHIFTDITQVSYPPIPGYSIKRSGVYKCIS